MRGVFNRTQTPDQVCGLAETIAFVFPARAPYGVGWDGRKVSALLARTVIPAVASVGSDVVAFGLVPTPVIPIRHQDKGSSSSRFRRHSLAQPLRNSLGAGVRTPRA